MAPRHPFDAWALRAAVAFIWLATGLSALHPAYRAEGLRYLGLLGWPSILMDAACVMEVLLGLCVLAVAPNRVLTGLQMVGIAFFTLVLLRLDLSLYAHPFGVLSKNVSLICLVFALHLVERHGWTTQARMTLRFGMVFIWIWEGVVVCAIHTPPELVRVLESAGLNFGDTVLLLRIVGVAQAASGLVVLFLSGWPLRVLLALQALGLVVITLLVTDYDPQLWFHPFGPLTKNIPLIVGTVVALRRSGPEDA